MNARDRYPQLEVDLGKLKENLTALRERCQDSFVGVIGVVKGVNAWREVVSVFDGQGFSYLATSRVDQLQKMRAQGVKTPLILLRVPMLSELSDVVSLADASLQSDITVLRALNAEAERQGKTHGVLLMIDLGDLREGFWSAEELVDAAVEVEQKMKRLHLLGVGVNLGCYGSILPDRRNMQGLVSLAVDVERAIGRELEFVSGGASTSAQMTLSGMMPGRVNNLRLGEICLIGSANTGFAPDFLHRDVFTLRAEVVECRDKPSFPVGQLSVDAFGHEGHYVDRGIRRRALLAIGRVDCGDCFDLKPRMPGVEIIGASGDHTILDVEEVKDQIHVGDVLEFDVNYASLVHLTNTPGIALISKE
ncbi:MAG: alanine/ornithine racemase family PLP-dependent enzyme [Ruminococcaceae bacterium]|jgi:predicted amino acid racemase|nr:alanine/ornithine racemase family PLP-dependent enzyme [Oscillospiraceae bacterium]